MLNICDHARDKEKWEEDLWLWLSSSPDDPARKSTEERISSCRYCAAGALALARAESLAGKREGWTLQQIKTRIQALEHARTVNENDWFRTVVTIVRGGLVRMSRNWIPEPEAIVRRRNSLPPDPEVMSEKHVVGDLEVTVEIERTRDTECRVAVSVRNNRTGKSSEGSAALHHENGTLYESFPFRTGEIVFSGVTPGAYYVTIETEGAPAGRIRLEILEGG